MSIRRAKFSFEGQFTQIPNEWARDKALSLKARGLLLELMSHQEGWNTSLAKLCSDRDGEAAVKSAALELEEAKLLTRVRNYSSGSLVWDWVLGEIPPEDLPPQNLLVSNLRVSNRPPKNTKLQEDQNKRTQEKNTIDSSIFDQFWAAYPAKKSKGQARTAFNRALKKTSFENLLTALEAYKQSKPVKDGYIKNPATWLNGECWEDEQAPSPTLAEFDRLVAADDKPAVEALLGERCREPAEFVDLDVSVRAERFTAYFREWAAARRHKLSS